MKRFSIWVWLWSMMFFMIVDDDGGGGGGDDDGVDFVIDDDPAPGTKDDETKKTPQDPPDKKEEKPAAAPSTKLDEATQKELDELNQFKDEALREKAIVQANNKLTAAYPDFDLTKVTAKLKEIHKEDPELAAELNNPTGWENLHLKYFRKTGVEGDPFDPGSKGAKEPFDFEATQKKALGGDKRELTKLFDNAK